MLVMVNHSSGCDPSRIDARLRRRRRSAARSAAWPPAPAARRRARASDGDNMISVGKPDKMKSCPDCVLSHGDTRIQTVLPLNSNCPTYGFKLTYYDGHNLLMCPPRTDPGSVLGGYGDRWRGKSYLNTKTQPSYRIRSNDCEVERRWWCGVGGT